MFQYKNHRFHFGGVSFQIPDGYFFNSEPGGESDNFIQLYAPDQTFTVDIRIEKDCDEVIAELQSVLDDLDPTIVYPPAPLQMNGLTGCHATYRNRRSQSYEAWFELGSETALSMTLTTPGNILDIDTAAVLSAIDPRADEN